MSPLRTHAQTRSPFPARSPHHRGRAVVVAGLVAEVLVVNSIERDRRSHPPAAASQLEQFAPVVRIFTRNVIVLYRDNTTCSPRVSNLNHQAAAGLISTRAVTKISCTLFISAGARGLTVDQKLRTFSMNKFQRNSSLIYTNQKSTQSY